jgi:hypothetical protein
MLRYGLAGTHQSASNGASTAALSIVSVGSQRDSRGAPRALAASASARGMARWAVTPAS